MHESDRNLSIEEFSGTAISQLHFSILFDRNACPLFAVFLVSKQIIHHFRIQRIFIFLLKLIQWSIYIIIGKFQSIHNIYLIGAIKYRCSHIESKYLCSKTQVNLQYLSDIHSRRHTQWIQHDIQRTSVW